MSAPDLSTLYDFESHFIAAAKTLLDDLGFALIGQHEAESRETPYALVEFKSSGSGAEALRAAPDGALYFADYSGTLTISVVSLLGRLDQDLGGYRGAVRAALSNHSGGLKKPTLPYYDVYMVRESETQNAVDGERDLLISSIAFEIRWTIEPVDWPA